MSSCSAPGRAVVAVLHPNPRSNSSRRNPPGASPPYSAQLFPAGLGCFKKKLPRKLGSRPKLLLFYHLSYWQGKEETEQFVSQPGFAGHEKAKSWWERPSGGEGRRGKNKWRVEISPVRAWGTRMDTVQEGEQTLSRSFADPYSQLFPHFPLQQFKCCQKVK